MEFFENTPWIFLDCQTTGVDPIRGHVFQIAWAILPSGFVFHPEASGEIAINHSLVALPEGHRVPFHLQRLLKLDSLSLTAAPDGKEVWQTLLDELRPVFKEKKGTAVIHYAQFETPFLTDLHSRHGEPGPRPWTEICTLKISRKLFPGLPSHGIRAVVGHLGNFLENRYDATSHVRATLIIWSHLFPLLKERSIETADQLRKWLATKESRPKNLRHFLVTSESRIQLPDSPGIYKMTTKNGKVLYIGKATSLKHRVSSYFKRTGQLRLAEMMAQVHHVDVKDAATPLEAALIESDEIKAFNPPYNTLLRVDRRKIYFYARNLRATSEAPSEEFPYGPFATPFLRQGLEEWEMAAPPERLNAARAEAGIFWEPSGEQDFPLKQSLYIARKLSVLGAAVISSPGDLPNEDENEEALADLELTSTELAKTLLRRMARTAVKIRNAAWLCRLTESTVVFRESGREPRRVLEITGGRVKGASYVSINASAPAPMDWKIPLRQRQALFDVITYDRMRVLWTELLNVVQKGGSAEFLRRPARIEVADKYLKSYRTIPSSAQFSQAIFDAIHPIC